MAADDFNKPLGLTPAKAPRGPRYYLVLAGGGIALAGLAAAGWMTLPGEDGPTATAVINAPSAAGPIVPERTGSTVPADGLTEIAPTGSLTDIGEVVIYGAADEAQPIRLAALPDHALIEESADGPLPRIGNDGTRPLEAYARPNAADDRDTRIAIVIGGIGIDGQGTRNAIAALPGAITLAFAPYGDDLSGALAAARADGHEILLQIPLEPFNYPQTDPGPNTLITDAAPEENIDRLHWFLGRLTNYIGVVNYMGARFTSEPAALKPVIAEIGGRGLLYLDDGSSARSTAADVASGVAPFLRADIVLDGDLSAAAIDARLGQLQAIARERGYAIATATAFPVTVERVAAFARSAAGKGIVLVPLSALAAVRS